MIDFGLSSQQFFSDYHERRYFLRRGALDCAHYSWQDINDLLYVVEPRAPFMRVFQDGPVEEARYAEDYADMGLPRRRLRKHAFYELLEQGATVVLNRLEVASAKLRRLSMDVSSFAGANAIVNGYLAYGGDGTFGKHWDTHDVFVVQLLGRKRWQVFEPTMSLPTRQQTSKDVKEFCPPTPVFDGILEPGDVMYIPRGWWHEAMPTEGETFHVAIGLHTPTLMDYAVWSCGKYLKDHPECRRSFRMDDPQQNDVEALAGIVAGLLSDRSKLEQFQRDLYESERISTPLNAELFSPQTGRDLDSQSTLLLSANLRGSASRRFAPINGHLGRRSPEATRIIELMSRGRPTSLGTIASQLDDVSPDKVKETVQQLIKENCLIIA